MLIAWYTTVLCYPRGYMWWYLSTFGQWKTVLSILNSH